MIARVLTLVILFATAFAWGASAAEVPSQAFFEAHCYECHDATAKGNLDLSKLKFAVNDPEYVSRWVTVFDRVSSNEMPPK